MARTVNVDGLSWELIEVVEWFVAVMREANEVEILPNPDPNERPTDRMGHFMRWAMKHATFPVRPTPNETNAEWRARLREWAEAWPDREVVIDDSRETIYAGRGE